MKQAFLFLQLFALCFTATALAQSFSPGPSFPGGIEPGDPTVCEAPAGNRCWWVDAAAPAGGNGTYASPYRSFETVAGYYQAGTYYAGRIVGGDYLYVKGTFSATGHDMITNSKVIWLGRASQSGTPSRPTVIKSWRGTPRAIFDGENSLTDIIRVFGLASGRFNSITIQNIEIKRAKSRALLIDEYVLNANLNNIVVHHTIGDGILGTGGAVVFYPRDSLHRFTLRNSLIYQNDEQPTGGENNRGGVTILSEMSAVPGSEVIISDNEVHSEIHAIRHKHSGTVKTTVYGNYIHDSKNGFYIRSLDNEIHHNLFKNIQDHAVDICNENQTADSSSLISQNTIIEGGAVTFTCGQNTVARRVRFFNNLVYARSFFGFFFEPGKWIAAEYDLTQWIGDHNLFDISSAEAAHFLIRGSSTYSFSSGMSLLNDSTSFQATAGFTNLNGNDYTVIANSPAVGAGQGGRTIGAFEGSSNSSNKRTGGEINAPFIVRNTQGECLPSIDICGDGISQDCDGEDSLCQGSDQDSDGIPFSTDCDDRDRRIFSGTWVSCRTACGTGVQQCQSTGNFSTCTCTPLCEATGSGRCYYVSLLTGNDSNDGSFNSPWKTLKNIHYSFRASAPRPTSLIPGDVVYLMSGLYEELKLGTTNLPPLVLSGVNGSSGAKIRIRGYPGANASIMGSSVVGALQVISSSYLVFSDLLFEKGLETALDISNSNNIEVSNAVLHGIRGSSVIKALRVRSSSNVDVNHSIFFDNRLDSGTVPSAAHLSPESSVVTETANIYYDPQ